jgi:hypothetical protein
MSTAIVAQQLARQTVRRFSAQAPQSESRATRFVATSCIVSAVVLPFIPPALESSREKSQGYPNHNKRTNPPLCFHAR